MNSLSRLLAICLIFLTSGALTAQVLVIKAGTLIDPATGSTTQDQYIAVVDGRIQEISAQPLDGELIDLSGSYVLPGLMDCHVHLTYNDPVNSFTPPKKYAQQSTAERAMLGLYNAGLLLRAGFTTVKEIGNDAEYATAAVRKAIANRWFEGPTIIYAGKIIAPYGGQIEGISPEAGAVWDKEYIVAETADEMRKAIHQNVYYGANVIKLVSDAMPYYYEQELIEAAVKEVDRLGLKVTAHVMGGEAARNVIEGGAHGIEHGFELDEPLLRLMKERGTFLVGTDFHADHLDAMAGDFDLSGVAPVIVERLRKAHEMGVKMAFGTDAVVDLPGMDRAETNLYFLKTWKQAGIPPEDILRYMTSEAAELLGIQEERGHLQTGRYADIIATRDNPLVDIENLGSVHFVMKEGKVIRQDP